MIGWFNKQFVHGGIIDKKYGRIINTAYLRRKKGDYEVHVEFDKETVEMIFIEMIEFIETIEKLVDSK